MPGRLAICTVYDSVILIAGEDASQADWTSAYKQTGTSTTSATTWCSDHRVWRGTINIRHGGSRGTGFSGAAGFDESGVGAYDERKGARPHGDGIEFGFTQSNAYAGPWLGRYGRACLSYSVLACATSGLTLPGMGVSSIMVSDDVLYTAPCPSPWLEQQVLFPRTQRAPSVYSA